MTFALAGCSSTTDAPTDATEPTVSDDAAEIAPEPEVVEEESPYPVVPQPVYDPEEMYEWLYKTPEEIAPYLPMFDNLISAGLAGDYKQAAALISDGTIVDTLTVNEIGREFHTEGTTHATFWTVTDKDEFIFFDHHRSNGAVHDYYTFTYRQKNGTGFSMEFSSEEGRVSQDTQYAVGSTSNYLITGEFTEVYYHYDESNGKTFTSSSTASGTAVDEMYNSELVVYSSTGDGRAWEDHYTFANGEPQAVYTDADGKNCTRKRVYTNGSQAGEELFGNVYYSTNYVYYSGLVR